MTTTEPPVCQTSPDFYVQNEGSIFLLTPNTPKALAWVEESISGEATTYGPSTVVEHRYIRDIVEGIRDSGMSVQQA